MTPVPAGEDNWIAFVEDAIRRARNNEARAQVLEVFDDAIRSEPTSLRVWLAYCEYFWTLYTGCMNGPVPGWTREDQIEGRQVFSLNDALSLWNRGYDAIKWRVGDSHRLWDRWVSLELEQLARTRTPEGVKRITHLFRNRLQTPHQTWDCTSSMFSTFLTEYNKAVWEEQMAEVTRSSKEAKELYQQRDRYEVRLAQAERSGNPDAIRAAMKEYLGWEIAQCRKDHRNKTTTVDICLGLFGRALSGIFTTDENIWNDYLVFLSTLQAESKAPKDESTAPTPLQSSQRAVSHCSWSGSLWARYMLNGEEAGLPFVEMEKIKHEATTSQLGRDGMAGVVEMYSAWCGYLKRSAIGPNASDEAIDLADVGLPSAIEDVQTWGQRLYQNSYQGDPNFRLERIYIQFLTEKHGAVEEARKVWNGLAARDLYANSYNFWAYFYMWEMLVFTVSTTRNSPTPSGSAPKVVRIPTLATQTLQRAVNRNNLDWPERILDVFLQHCNDYELPGALRKATDLVHRVRKRVVKRREAEQMEQIQVQQAWQAQRLERLSRSSQEQDSLSPSGGNFKRKRDASLEAEDGISKRAKNQTLPSTESNQSTQPPKRDREHTSVLVTGLPADVTQSHVKKFFAEYGHINNLTVKNEKDGQSAIALIEFRTVEDAQSAMMRKYFERTPINVSPGTDLTLFVTNFPPHADDKYMHDLFRNCGEIFSIRWPSLKFNTHRRFCYVSFRDTSSSAKATKLDGKMLEGKYKLEAKYSDPGNKKARDGAVAEGREVHVKSLDQELGESDVRDAFAKYGKVESVKILRTHGGKSRGSGFVVFETKSQAETATQALNKTKFGRSILNAEVSVHKNYKPVSKTVRGRSGTPASNAGDAEGDVAMTDDVPSGSGANEGKDCSFALMELPDTVNDARVNNLLSKYGEVVKLVLRPDHSGAIAEFADAASAGKASLGLEGLEFEGRKLRTGPVKELFQKLPPKNEDRALMPPPVRRPVALGRGKPKRGLGFVSEGKKSDDGANNGASDSGDAPPRKSNADFKAMFLDSGSKQQDGGGADEAEASK
ncbi:hypothetical protein MKZ38_010261 [Zalerion maritima]|uniref:U4/U6 snRNA-associated-splicing factor PRP24 n=1 Tax=Zalerion maritima TaxID=339359 RepID=A0AAD5RSJ5_9PEZI|nr:hypothetical protein MKZ38_010261 [Zalerion maritima]